jgi:hypothetical protein
MSAPSIPVQQLINARNAVADVHNYHSTREAMPTTQALLETVTVLVDNFYGEASAIGRALSKEEADAAAIEVENAVNAYLLHIEQLIDQAAPMLGKTGLRDAYDVLAQTLQGEVERLKREARAAV